MGPFGLLAHLLARGGRAVLVLVRSPRGDDLKDGYFQRIHSVDGLLAGVTRVHVHDDRSHRTVLPRVVAVADGAFEVRCRLSSALHFGFLVVLARACRTVYAHSVYTVAPHRLARLFAVGRTALLDFHGVVPEELALLGDPRASSLSAVEARAVARADAIVTITNAMTAHIRRKYAVADGAKRFLLLPHMPVRPIGAERPRYSKDVVYCGGLQAWQQIGKTLAWVHAHRDECRFTFLVPQPEELKRRYRELHGEEFPGLVTTARPDELGGWYARHAFGLVLRQDTLVNRVACPSKFVEYLLHGLVPIVESDDVGDFKALGVRTVGVADPLPDEGAWHEMVERNREALVAMDRTFREGAAALRDLVDGLG